MLAVPEPTSGSGRLALDRLVNAVRRESRDGEAIEAVITGSPSVAEVLATTLGPRVVVPLLLSSDTPLRTWVREPAAPHLHASVTAPLGPDWALAEMGVQRLIEAGARSDDSIVLAAEAVSGADAVADVCKAARFLSAVWGGRVHVGLLGGPGPPLADAIDIARAYGKRVVIASYVLTEGDAHDAMSAAGADVLTAPLVRAGAPDPRLVALIVARSRARAGLPSSV